MQKWNWQVDYFHYHPPREIMTKKAIGFLKFNSLGFKPQAIEKYVSTFFQKLKNKHLFKNKELISLLSPAQKQLLLAMELVSL